METSLSLAESGFPVWLVSRNDSLHTVLERRITSSGSYVLDRRFADWHDMLRALRKRDGEGRGVAIVEERLPRLTEFNWISMLVASSFSVIALLSDIDDVVLTAALSAGVTGLLVKPTVDQILATMSAVLYGGIVMSPEILDRLRPSSKCPGKVADSLSERELCIVRLIAQGHNVKEIAEELCISYLTVRTHIKNIHSKLKINSNTTLAHLAHREGIF